MARKQRDEMAFGSDSFLDVVANIVGILIILIVVVGVRVAHSPVPGQHAEAAPVVAAIESAPPESPPLPPQPLPELPELPPLPGLDPPQELIDQAEQLRKQHDELLKQLQQLSARHGQIIISRREREQLMSDLRSKVSDRASLLRNERGQLSTLQQDVDALKGDILAMQQSLALLNSEDGPVQKLTHELPPIGRVVTGNEIHFRLAGNRVTRVPIDQLAQEVQRDVERRKEILLTRSFYQGTTRPLDGYIMDYVLQRQAMTLQEELRHGRGMIRIGVTGWVIKPVGPLNEETLEQALRSGSEFQTALRREGPTATVTFWVYPDSFEIHRQLKAWVHDAGFWVASRPLPEGIPIAGSPQGSKSLAQ